MKNVFTHLLVISQLVVKHLAFFSVLTLFISEKSHISGFFPHSILNFKVDICDKVDT